MKAEQQQFHGGFTCETKRNLSVLNTLVTHGHLSHLATRRRDSSVANKFICSNFALFDPGIDKRLAHGRHHSGRPGQLPIGKLQRPDRDTCAVTPNGTQPPMWNPSYTRRVV
jgi:hypothetical protein